MVNDEWSPQPDPEVSRRQSCWLTAVSLIVIISLLGTTLGGVVWFLRSRSRQPTPTPTSDTRIVAAAEPTAVATATPLLPTPTMPATAVEPLTVAQNGQIVLINAEQQLELVYPDGTGRQLLTAAPVHFQFPAWAPDNRSIAAIGTSRTGAGVFVLPTASQSVAEPEPVYFSRRNNPIYLYWAPDSQQVSFIASGSLGLDLYLAPADGSAESRMVAAGQPIYWRWLANGRQILLSTGEAGGRGAQVLLLDIGNGSQDSLAASGRFQSPDVSANGRYLAYAITPTLSRRSELVLQDTTTGAQNSETHAGRLALGWSPTADYLAVINPLEESDFFFGPLRLLDAATGQVRQLSSETVLAFFWSPNGRYLAYLTFAGRQPGQQQATDRRRLAKLAQQTDQITLNLSLVDVTTGEGLQLLEFQPSLRFWTQFLPFFDQYAHSHTLWSPDSRALVLPVLQDGVEQIVVVPATGGRYHVIGQGDIAFWSRP